MNICQQNNRLKVSLLITHKQGEGKEKVEFGVDYIKRR